MSQPLHGRLSGVNWLGSASRRAGRPGLLRWALALVLASLGALFGCATARAADQGGTQPRFALIIANTAYPDAETPLDSAGPDSHALREELQRAGFTVDLRENAPFGVMRDAIEHLVEIAGPKSAALIYFKGYGIQAFHQSYMIPIDARIWSDDEIRTYGFPIDDLLVKLDRHGVQTKIAIIDAAYSNPFERRYRKVPLGLAPANAPDGALILFSAALGKVVEDHPHGMSLFGRELIKQIGVRNQTAEDVFNQTRLHVAEATQGEQVPWMSSSMGQGFSFGHVEPTRYRSAILPPASTPPETPSDCSDQTGTVVLDDPFTDNRGGWDLRDRNVKLDPPGLALLIGDGVSGYSVQNTISRRLDGDYCISFDLPAPLANGARSGAGLEFWAKDYKNFYAALLFSDRTVGLYEHRAAGWRTIVETRAAVGEAIPPPRQNSIRAVVKRGTASLYLNGALIRQATVTPPASALRFGVYAQVGRALPSAVGFRVRNFRVLAND